MCCLLPSAGAFDVPVPVGESLQDPRLMVENIACMA